MSSLVAVVWRLLNYSSTELLNFREVSMLMIRLARFGAKKKPFYRIVVIEKEKARDGRNIEVVGHYNSRTTPAKVDLKYERINHWVKVGAQMSKTVARLVKNNPATAAEPAT